MARKREFEFGDEELPEEPFAAVPDEPGPRHTDGGVESRLGEGYVDDLGEGPGSYEPLAPLVQEPPVAGRWQPIALADSSAPERRSDDGSLEPEAPGPRRRDGWRTAAPIVGLLVLMIPLGLLAGSILAGSGPSAPKREGDRAGRIEVSEPNEPRVETRARPPREHRQPRVAPRAVKTAAPAPKPAPKRERAAIARTPAPATPAAPQPPATPAPATPAPVAPKPVAPTPVAPAPPIPEPAAALNEFGFER